MEIDCPSTVGQPDPLQTTFFALRNSANPILQENSKQFSRKQRYASLVQILSCESEPALVNKILVWRYGFKIHEKIQNEMNPPMGEPKNPFNMLTGRPFSVVVKEVSGYQNYDASGFFDLGLPDSAMRMIVPNAQGQPQVYAVTPETVANAQGKQMVFDYLIKILLFKVCKRKVISLQERKPRIVILKVERLSHSLWKLVYKAENAFVAAGTVIVHKTAFK